jgi:hypothetical protein
MESHFPRYFEMNVLGLAAADQSWAAATVSSLFLGQRAPPVATRWTRLVCLSILSSSEQKPSQQN